MKKIFFVGVMVLAMSIAMVSGVYAQGTVCGDTDYDCKIAQLKARIRSEPANYELYYNLGRTMQFKEDWTGAIPMLDMYIASGVTNKAYLADGYNRRGLSYLHLKQYDAAVKDFSKAIELAPAVAVFYTNRADSYTDSGNITSALTDFTRAIALDPKDYWNFTRRGYIYMKQTLNDKAIVDFTKGIELEPGYEENYYNRGTCYNRLAQYNKAILDFDKYIAMNQAHAGYMADGYNNRALSYAGLGNNTQALADHTKAIELAPSERHYRNRALIYRKLNKIALADADDKKADALAAAKN